MLPVLTLHDRAIHFSDSVPTDPIPIPEPIPRPQPMPDPPPDEEPIKMSHRTRRSARIRACRL